MSRHNLVSIIVPALNEGKTIRELFYRIRKVMQSLNRPFEFVVIDDGSTDNTFELLKGMSLKYQNIVVIRHFRNHGKSLALMQGFDIARGDVAITMDADLQDLPEDISFFLEKIDQGYDMVNGWRINRKDSAVKRLVSKLFNIITSLFLKCNLHDINCGFKAIRRDVYQRLELRGDLHRLIPAIAISYGFRVTEIQVRHADRKFGNSRYRLLRHRGILDIISLIATSATQIRPFHIFSEIAALFWFAFFISFLTRVGIKLAVSNPSVGIAMLSDSIFYIGIWSGLVGTIAPLFGLTLEIMTKHHQDLSWRKNLVKDRILSQVFTNDGLSSHTKRVSPRGGH
jgi:glycosyltransferase involved in cell wall biosynthesis